MTDKKLDQTISDWLEAERPGQLPDRVLRATFERTRKTSQRVGLRVLLGRLSMPRYMPALATAAIVLVVGVVTLGVYLNRPGIGVAPSPTPSASPSPSSSASASPVSPTIRPEVVHGWPGRRPGGSPAGLYSWVSWYSNNPLHRSWMHNGGVEILMGDAPASACLGGATHVTVAGHNATHTQIDDLELAEEWIVDFPERCLAIRLTARLGTSQADLDEAHAIIESLTYEPRDPPLTGFRLIFRLTTDDWDSG
jgi:hypothetical protein